MTAARAAPSPGVPVCFATTPMSPVSDSAKPNRNAQWITRQLSQWAITASWAAPSPPPRSGRGALVPHRRYGGRAPLLYAGHAGLGRLLGRARPLPGRHRVLPHHRLHNDPRQRVPHRRHGLRRARRRSRGRAPDPVSRGRLLRDLRVRVLRHCGDPRPAAARLARLVERGDRQRDRGLRDGLLPVAPAPQDRGKPEAASAGGDGRGRVRTRKSERGTRNISPIVGPSVPRSAFPLPPFRTPPAVPLAPRHRILPARSTGTTRRSPWPTAPASPRPTSAGRPAAGPRAGRGPRSAAPRRRTGRVPAPRA